MKMLINYDLILKNKEHEEEEDGGGDDMDEMTMPNPGK